MSKLYSFYCRFLSFLFGITFGVSSNVMAGCNICRCNGICECKCCGYQIIDTSQSVIFGGRYNILVISDPGVSKFQFVKTLLYNTQNVESPKVKCDVEMKTGRIYGAGNNNFLRIIAFDTEEFLNFDKNSVDFNYIINNINHVFYIMDDSHKNLEKMARVYDRINETICKKYKVSYTKYSPYSDDEARVWWKKLIKFTNEKWPYSFSLLINSSCDIISDSLQDYCNAMPNGRKIYIFPFEKEPFLLTIDSSLINYIKKLGQLITPRTFLSHNFYNKTLTSRLYHKVIDFFCFFACCVEPKPSENISGGNGYNYYNINFKVEPKNHKGTDSGKCEVF